MFELVLKSDFKVVECNFEALEQELRTLIKEKYDIVVTEDSVKDAKSTRAEINKGKKALEQAWRERKSELEAPIKALNEKAKTLFAVCDEAILKIDNQVTQFEAGKREQALTLCKEYAISLCEKHQIPTDSIVLNGFNNLSYVTDKGALASAGKQAVEKLVLEAKTRLLEEEQRKMQEELEKERIRQEAREELLAEQKAKASQEEPEYYDMRINENEGCDSAPEEDKPKASQGKSIYTIQASFAIASATPPSEELFARMRAWFEEQLNPTLKQSLQKVEVK